jgi:tetratricopeptide (TPR) repeat protein
MDPKPLTIQELETLNLADYKDKPDELLKIGKDLLKAKRFEKSIEVLEEALKQNIKKSKNEFSIDCAKSYFYYADALIYKLQETGEMFQAVNVKPKEESKEQHSVANNNFNNNSDDIQVSKISQSQKPNLMVEGEEKLDNMEENDFIDDEESFEEETDEQVLSA